MCPEFGATSALFPFDGQTLKFYERQGQSKETLYSVYGHLRKCGLDADQSNRAVFDHEIHFDLNRCQSVVARPCGLSQKLELAEVGANFQNEFRSQVEESVSEGGLLHGDIVLAAITSCTNTGNKRTMIAAGLLARKAVPLGIKTAPRLTALKLEEPTPRQAGEKLSSVGELVEKLKEKGFLCDEISDSR